MKSIILLIIVVIIYFILRFIFDVNIKKLKQIGEDKELDEITKKYPENVEICKYYLKKLDNENVKIEEDKNSNATLYLADTTLYVLESAVAQSDGYTWDKVRIRVNGKEGYMINKNYK